VLQNREILSHFNLKIFRDSKNHSDAIIQIQYSFAAPGSCSQQAVALGQCDSDVFRVCDLTAGRKSRKPDRAFRKKLPYSFADFVAFDLLQCDFGLAPGKKVRGETCSTLGQVGIFCDAASYTGRVGERRFCGLSLFFSIA